MCVTAVVVGGIIAAGASVASAEISAHAAHSAADKQSAAADKASDIQYKEWQQEQANIAPWVNAGKTSLSALMAGMGMGTYTAPGHDAPLKTYGLDETGNVSIPMAPGQTVSGFLSPGAAKANAGAAAASKGQPFPGLNADQMKQPNATGSSFQPKRGANTPGAGQPQPGGAQPRTGNSRVQWPDGTVAVVPAEKADQYVSLGAKEI